MNFLLNLLPKAFPLLGNLFRNRLLNSKTPKGVLLVVAGAYGFNLLDEQKVNFIISLIANSNITWMDFYLTVVHCVFLFLIGMGGWLIFAKVQRYSFQEKFSKEKK